MKWPPATSRLTLNDDILYQIFMFSTYTLWEDHGYGDSDLPLTTLRICSQVCVQWRRLLLGAKRIWGRSIDIDGLGKDEWIEEVLERAGDSLLTVRCGDDAAKLLGDSYVANLLGRLWPRIRELEIGAEVTYPSQIIEILERPTETMECFIATSDISFPGYDLSRSPSVSLFSGHAPNLAYIDLGKGVSKFKPEPIWESPSFFTNNIREICMMNESLVTLAQVLSACKRLPLLETLALDIRHETDLEDEAADTQEVIPMRHLSALETVSTQFGIYPAFLSRLSTAPGCRIYTEHIVVDEDYSDNHMVAMKQVYTTFSHSMFKTPRTDVSDKAKVSLGSRLCLHAYDNAICIDVRFYNAVRATEYYPSIIDAFLAVKMPSKYIDLSLDMKSYRSERGECWLGPTVMAQEDLPEVQYRIRLFLASMTWVTTLRMTYSDFVLIASPTGKLYTPNCFPRLQHLHLSDSGDADYGGVLLPFVLTSRLVTVNLSHLPWSPVDELVAYGLNRLDPHLQFIWNKTHYFSVAKGFGRLPMVKK